MKYIVGDYYRLYFQSFGKQRLWSDILAPIEDVTELLEDIMQWQ